MAGLFATGAALAGIIARVSTHGVVLIAFTPLSPPAFTVRMPAPRTCTGSRLFAYLPPHAAYRAISLLPQMRPSLPGITHPTYSAYLTPVFAPLRFMPTRQHAEA